MNQIQKRIARKHRVWRSSVGRLVFDNERYAVNALRSYSSSKKVDGGLLSYLLVDDKVAEPVMFRTMFAARCVRVNSLRET